MFNIALNSIFSLNVTPIPNNFIEHYMSFDKTPNSLFMVIYIYFYKECFSGSKNISTKTASEKLGILETEIIQALRYWQKENLVEFLEENEVFSLTFKEIPAKKEVCVDEEVLEASVCVNEAIISDLVENDTIEENKAEISNIIEYKAKKTFSWENKPNYSFQELDIYKKQSSEIKTLFSYAEKSLGKFLNEQDLSTIFSFYDWLHLPIKVIETLIDSCVKKGHRNLKYIEKVALDWAENNIDDSEKAAEYINDRNLDFKKIMTAFGCKDRLPVAFEIDYMKVWLLEYKMPIEVIEKACEKTIANVGKINFSYANSIIKNWQDKNVKTLEDTIVVDMNFADAQEKKAKDEKLSKKFDKTEKKNSSEDSSQRKWDYDFIQKAEHQMLVANLKNYKSKTI